MNVNAGTNGDKNAAPTLTALMKSTVDEVNYRVVMRGGWVTDLVGSNYGSRCSIVGCYNVVLYHGRYNVIVTVSWLLQCCSVSCLLQYGHNILLLTKWYIMAQLW